MSTTTPLSTQVLSLKAEVAEAAGGYEYNACAEFADAEAKALAAAKHAVKQRDAAALRLQRVSRKRRRRPLPRKPGAAGTGDIA